KNFYERMEVLRQENEQIYLENMKISEAKWNEANLKFKEFLDRSENLITEENFDSAYENALMNPVDYNYAIDFSGKIIGKGFVEQSIEIQ
ncbi:MAG: Mitochondrial ribosome subunit S26, partial [Paramarteilia canceri]